MQRLAQKGKVTSEILTVMFADIVGYTKTAAQLSREQFHKMLDMFEDLAAPVIKKYDGKIIKKLGDAFLLTFKSPTDAVLCGVELQRAFWYYNESRNWQAPLIIRVAIHTGEVLHRNSDVYGDAVNIASRIENFAPAGHVVFSESVFTAMNKSEIPSVHLGLQNFKGVQYPIRVFRVKTRYDDIKKKRDAIKKFITRTVLISGGSIALIYGLRYLWFSGFI